MIGCLGFWLTPTPGPRETSVIIIRDWELVMRLSERGYRQTCHERLSIMFAYVWRSNEIASTRTDIRFLR